MGKLSRVIVGLLSSLMVATATAAMPVEGFLAKQGAIVESRFKVGDSLWGLVTKSKTGSQKRLFYATPDGKLLIAGMIWDAQGQNLTEAHLKSTPLADVGGPASVSQKDMQALYKRLPTLAGITEGHPQAPLIYIFFDPNCGYCHATFSNLRQAVANGEVRVRWLPVAILADSSWELGATLLRRPADLNKMIYRTMLPVKPTEAERLGIARNVLTLRDSGYTGVPLTLFQLPSGTIRIVKGQLEAQNVTTIRQMMIN